MHLDVWGFSLVFLLLIVGGLRTHRRYSTAEEITSCEYAGLGEQEFRKSFKDLREKGGTDLTSKCIFLHKGVSFSVSGY